MKKDYILLKSENRLLKKWIIIDYEDFKLINDIEDIIKYPYVKYLILYNIENKYDYDNDCYYLDKVWEKLFVDYMED